MPEDSPAGATPNRWLEALRRLLFGSRPITVHQGASDQLFRDLTAAQRARLPRYSGDLLLTRHSAGMLTSQAMMKRWNRKNELLADAAERLAVIAAQLGAAYPLEALRTAWLRVLGSQMHDILPGTSLPRCYEYAHNDEAVAANTFAGLLADAAATLASGMDTTCAEGAISLLVYNPLAFARQDVVEATVPLRAPAAVRVTGPQGQAVPAQIVSRTGDEVRILFLADLPACGAAAFEVVETAAPLSAETGLRVDRQSLENGRYRVTLNAEGQVASIVDKVEGGCELLSRPIEHQFLREHPRIFPAWNMEWKDRKRPPFAVLGGPAQIEVVESGPVRVSVRITRAHGASRFQQEVRLACGDAGNRIEFADTIDWRETGCSLKAAFATAAPGSEPAPEAAYNWELGVICRGNNDPRKFEVPAHRWFDLTDPQGQYGVSVLEDCKYGSDKPTDDVLRLTLLFTPRVGPLEVAFRDQGSQDWGRHRMLYGLYGHRGDWREGRSEQQSLRLNQPPLAFRVPAAPGPLGRTFSFLQLDSEQVGVRAIKQAEERDTIILRLQELWGRPTGEVTLALGGAVAAWETDGCERRLREVAVRDGRFATEMGPFALQTFEVQLGPLGAPGASSLPPVVEDPRQGRGAGGGPGSPGVSSLPPLGGAGAFKGRFPGPGAAAK